MRSSICKTYPNSAIYSNLTLHQEWRTLVQAPDTANIFAPPDKTERLVMLYSFPISFSTNSDRTAALISDANEITFVCGEIQRFNAVDREPKSKHQYVYQKCETNIPLRSGKTDTPQVVNAFSSTSVSERVAKLSPDSISCCRNST